MATFAYYNPQTNTIERRHPGTINKAYQYMPQLLNFQPQDLSYAAKTTVELRADAPFPKVPQPFQQKTQQVNRQPDIQSDNVETVKLNKKPFDDLKSSKLESKRDDVQRQDIPPTKGDFTLRETEPAPNEFLFIEDLREEDLQQVPEYYQPSGNQRNNYPQQYNNGKEGYRGQPSHTDYYDNRRYSNRAPPQHYHDDDDYGYQDNPYRPRSESDFNIIRPDKLTIKYKPEEFDVDKVTKIPNFAERDPSAPEEKLLSYNPEELSMNERILNAKHVGKQQEKTRQFIMKRIENDLNALEKYSNGLEKDLETTGQQTDDLEAKSKAMWKEVERKKFEMRANDIMKKIDQAIDLEPEYSTDVRLEKFYQENEALFAQVDKVLAENNMADPYGDHNLRNIVEETEMSEYSDPSRFSRRNSSNVRTLSNIPHGNRSAYEGYDDYDQPRGQRMGSSHATRDEGRYNLDRDMGRKNIVRMVSEDKTRNATRVYMKNPIKRAPTLQNLQNRRMNYKNKKPVKKNISNKGTMETAANGYTGEFNSRNIDNSIAYRRRVVAVKNPKKVEEALKRANEIASYC